MQKRPTVRLNLNKPRHRQAWEYLQSRRDRSHTEVIVDALIQAASSELPAETIGIIRKAVGEAVREALHTNAYTPAAERSRPSEPTAMTDDDFDIAMAFMNGL